MTNYSYGNSMNTPVYGKAANSIKAHNQYYPSKTISRGPVPMCRGHKVEYTFCAPKFRMNWGGFILGALPFAFRGIGAIVDYFKGNKNSKISTPYTPGYTPSPLGTQTKTNPNAGKTEANLQGLYGKNFNIREIGPGQFMATNKDETKQFGPASFDEMCALLKTAMEDPANNIKTNNTIPANQANLDNPDNPNGNKVTGNNQENEGLGALGNGNNTNVNHNNKPKGSKSSKGFMDGWYRAQGNINSAESSAAHTSTVQAESKKTGFSDAKTTVNLHILQSKLTGALTPAQMDALTKEVIAHNRSVFNEDGSYKTDAKGTIAINKLDIPTMDWIKTNILGETDGNKTTTSGSTSATAKAQSQTTKVGNNQYKANKFAQEGYRETDRKGVYYNEKTKKHYQEVNGELTEIKRDVRTIYSDGSYVDSKGVKHNSL